jgi:alpha-tubulin suppressor-like RCC1 family protein
MRKKIKLFSVGLLLAAMLMSQAIPVFATDGPSAVICAGGGVTFAIKKDGSLWGYGNQDRGVLGVEFQDTVSLDKSEGIKAKDIFMYPVKIMDDVKSVVTNEDNSFAIKRDNSLWAWGANDGNFGNGNGKASTLPVKIMDDVKMAATAREYTLIIKTDGSLWGTGQLPGRIPAFNGTTVYEFKQIMSGEKFKFVSACGYYAMVIKENGELWGWGNNDYAALGTGGTEDSIPEPIKVMDNVAFVSTDSSSSMIVREDGALYMCGTGYNGKFYDGTAAVTKINGDGYVKSPMKIMDNVLYAAVNGSRWLVVKRDNTLWGWGSDAQFGLLGRISKNTMIPAKLADSVSYVSAGSRHIAVLKTDSTLWTGGQNPSGGIAGHYAEYKEYPLQQDMTGIMDAPAPWALQEVNEAIEKGLVPSELQSDYTKPITRKEFSKLVVTMIEKKTGKSIESHIKEKGLSMPDQSPFTDVDDHYVSAAYSLSIVNGIGNNMFAPDKTINRQEAAKMLTSTARALGYETDAPMPVFDDGAAIDKWAVPYIGYMVEIGIMKGSNNRFDPKGTYVRQMAFITMNRIFNNLK